MQKLHLPDFNFRIRESENQNEIFDSVRKKFVALTPEEWVRQNFIRYLVEYKNVPPSLIAVEKSLSLNKLTKRTDIVIFGSGARARMIVECKAPAVKISQAVFEQIGRYNMTLQVEFLVVTNGLNHYCAQIDFVNNSFAVLNDIPDYANLA
mgnify:CR=1 FL=1